MSARAWPARSPIPTTRKRSSAIVDCIEFDRDLRELDVADDLTFLVFDLAAHGGARFKHGLVDAYRDAGGDPGDDALIAFFASYRTLVRAKVALVRGESCLASALAERSGIGQLSSDLTRKRLAAIDPSQRGSGEI